jgi:hypothetical protein
LKIFGLFEMAAVPNPRPLQKTKTRNYGKFMPFATSTSLESLLILQRKIVTNVVNIHFSSDLNILQ